MYNILKSDHKQYFKGMCFFIIPLLLLYFCSFNLHAEIRLSLQPNPVLAGEPASLTINSDEGKATINNLPKIDNLKWLENKNNYTESVVSINGITFEQTTYQFVVSKPGVITLPSMKITVGNSQYHTNETQIQVGKGELTDIDKSLYITPEYLIKNRENIYVGEEIPLRIDLYKSDSLAAVPAAYPQISLTNVVFSDFSGLNRETNKFAPYPYGTPKHITKDGANYTQTSFFTSFRALGQGLLKGTVSLLCNIKLSQTSRTRNFPPGFDRSFFSNNPFFSGSLFNRGRTVSKRLAAKLPELNILPLPSPPEKTNYLGLVGKWETTAKLSTTKIQEGEPLTLTLKIAGTGSLETLSAPELSLPSFTAYSPEIQKNTQTTPIPGRTKAVTINYVLIPTEPGKTNIDISFATFNPNKEQYDITSIKKNIDIIPGHSAKSVVYGTPSSKTSAIASKRPQESKVSSVILYLKKTPGNYTLIPLWKNHLGLVITLFLLGPLLWIIVELFFFRKNKFISNPTLKRRNDALKKKKSLIKKIVKANPNKLPELVQQELIPFINDLKGFSPGTTADELFVKLKERKLAEYIKEANTLSYMPTIKENSLSLRNNLVKALKRVSTFVIIGFILISINSNTFAEKNIPPENSNIQQLITAYNNADFAKAEKICKENIHLNQPRANWIYNLGNCYYQNGKTADAMVSYMQALRLAPRDSDILENLNFVRRKLLLPEVYQKKNPLAIIQSIRDTFRPDEWILIFAIAWFLIFISLIIRKFAPIKIWSTSILIAIALAILSLSAAISENAALYSNRTAIVVQKNPKIFTLPSSESSASSFVLNPGDQVNIEEKLHDWVRIRKGYAEGWVSNNTIRRIWPY